MSQPFVNLSRMKLDSCSSLVMSESISKWAKFEIIQGSLKHDSRFTDQYNVDMILNKIKDFCIAFKITFHCSQSNS